MTRIIVKNGDWDTARAELGANMDAKRNTFDAQFDSVFGARKPDVVTPDVKAAPVKAAGKLVLARPRRV
ncbi:MAG: hypothetical protein Q7T81_04415 [Pseudolabrys sp.]|nr:hypothetical protein [Pseudolabrys sp.]